MHLAGDVFRTLIQTAWIWAILVAAELRFPARIKSHSERELRRRRFWRARLIVGRRVRRADPSAASAARPQAAAESARRAQDFSRNRSLDGFGDRRRGASPHNHKEM